MKKVAGGRRKSTPAERSSAASDFRHPSSVLIAVTGMSPAILTETAWALAQQRPPCRIGRVIAFATTRSRDQLRQDLILSGIWEKLRHALKAGPDELIFSDAGDHIRVFSRRGRELDDLRTPEDNRAAADFILEHLRQFTENPDLHIVASIAGGRKTMGALLYAAMTLIGRDTDRVTHVLVDEELEQRRNPRFYYPENLKEAKRLYLADIPFVPLRNRFEDMGRLPGGFSALIKAYARSLGPDGDRPIIRLESNRVRIDDRLINLRPNEQKALNFLLHLNEPQAETRSFQDVQREFATFMGQDVSAKEELRKWVSSLRNTLMRAGSTWYPDRRPHPLRLPPFKLQR